MTEPRTDVGKTLDVRLLALALERAEDDYQGYGWPDAETHARAVIDEYEAMLNAPSAAEVRGILDIGYESERGEGTGS